ncbi:hypothetical protein [Streptomyces sp. DSM 40750]|uniref:hypothetical protein n=1 Tax=Streptomyces sp. DSM 40750 TaxID=2801030 RepID=UPI00214BF88A|nr:hypothetical protein [Streptomyces sp. DSM 40750]UUU28237.1 hypothetical protein JIX55_36380 [Streptomyces sp. DSM 40750]
MLVGAAGAGLLVGCSTGGEGSEGAGGSPSVVEKARARVAKDSGGLVERYDAVIAAHPALAALLTPLRAEVVRHAQAFGGGKGAASASASASASPAGSASPSASPSPVPEDPKAALAKLAAAERALADKRAKALSAVPGEVARLMASVAAAGAGHAYLLTEGAK